MLTVMAATAAITRRQFMTPMERLEAEAKVLNMINRLADCYGVKVKADPTRHIVEFSGDPAQCELLATKLCEIFVEVPAEEEAQEIACITPYFVE
jgi:hypothetical protein